MLVCVWVCQAVLLLCQSVAWLFVRLLFCLTACFTHSFFMSLCMPWCQFFYLSISCVFWPAFGCCPHRMQPKTGQTTFFSHFQPFLFNLNLFNDFTPEITEKCQKKKQKNMFFSIFVFSSKLVEMPKLVNSLRGYL